MRAMTAISIGICLSTCVLLPAMAADTPLNVKPGLWEVTSKGEHTGTPAIPPEMLAQMTPEQRARMEAAMQQSMARQSEPRVHKRCVTQDEINHGFEDVATASKGGCTRTVVSSSSTVNEGRVQCTGTAVTSATYRIEARSPESVTGTVETMMGSAGHTMTVKTQFQGKWLGADCGSIKPGQ